MVINYHGFYPRLLVRGRRLVRRLSTLFYSRLSRSENAVEGAGKFGAWKRAAHGLTPSKHKPETLYPYIKARAGVRSQFQPVAFVYLLAIVAIPIIYVRWIFEPYKQNPQYALPTVQGESVSITMPAFMVTATPAGFVPSMTSTSFQPPMVTPSETATPAAALYPTWTPGAVGVNPEQGDGSTETATATPAPVLTFLYSWYYPDLIVPTDFDDAGNCRHQEGDLCHTVNCWNYSVQEGRCISPTRSGQDWRVWVGRGVACPKSYPLLTVLHVLSPEQVAGYWTCVDWGSEIVGNRLDFMQSAQVLPWWTEIKAEVVNP